MSEKNQQPTNTDDSLSDEDLEGASGGNYCVQYAVDRVPNADVSKVPAPGGPIPVPYPNASTNPK